MDKLQQYLISHPALASSYARIWKTIQKMNPRVNEYRPKQFDDWLHQNEHSINKHLSSESEVKHGDIKRAGEMMWYYGPAALSAPVQAAIAALEGGSHASADNTDVTKGKKEKEEKNKTDHAQEHSYGPVNEAATQEGQQSSTEPAISPTSFPNKGMTMTNASAAIAAATAEAPQVQTAQKIQTAVDFASSNSVAAKIDTATASAPLSQQQHVAQTIEAAKPGSPANSSFVTGHGQELFSTPSETTPAPSRIPIIETSTSSNITPEGLPITQKRTFDEEGNHIENDIDEDDEQKEESASDNSFNRRDLDRMTNKEQPRSFQRRTPSQSSSTSPTPSPRSGGQGGNGDGQPPPRPPRARRAGGIPGMGVIGKAARGMRSAASVARAARAAAPIIAFFSTPPGWITIAIIIILFLILIIFFIVSGGFGLLNDGDVSVTVTKTGPEKVENGAEIAYTINVSYTNASQITVTDKLPEGTEFVSATGNHTYNPATHTVTWTVAAGGGGGAVSGDIASLLPNPVPPDPAGVEGKKSEIISHFQSNPELIQHYKDASAKTGLPWQVYAGLHWREGDALPGYSLTSGRPIGGYEPDPDAGGDCTGPVGAVDGKPDTNCTFANAVDDIMYASDHLVGKISKMPTTHEELSEALARYNGFPGRANCTPKSPLYNHCPELFPGEDNSYVFTFFDEKHAVMDEVFCGDGQRCGPLKATRPGAMTVIKWVSQGIQ